MPTTRPSRIVVFGVFEFDVETGDLWNKGHRIRLQEQPRQILCMLLARPGELVTREALRAALWPNDTFVDFDAGVNVAVNKIRHVLGDSASSPRFIETLPRRGYRFIAPVTLKPLEAPAAAPEASPSRDQAIAVPTAGRTHRRAGALALTAVGALAIAAVAIWLVARDRTPVSPTMPLLSLTTLPGSVTHTQVTFSGDVQIAALSPDGRTLAYVAGTRGGGMNVFVRDLTSGQAIKIWQGDWAMSLTWVGDGTQLMIGGMKAKEDPPSMWVVPRLGGEARHVTGRGIDWMATASPDGSHVATTWESAAGFHINDLSSGRIERRVALADLKLINGITWGTSNRLAMITTSGPGEYTVWTMAPDGQGRRRLYVAGGPWGSLISACWASAGQVLYIQQTRNRATSLLRVHDADAGAAASPELLVSGLPPSDSCSVSSDGRRLLQVRRFLVANLWQVDLRKPSEPPVKITEGTSQFIVPRVSPTGEWILSGLRGIHGFELVKIPLAGGAPVSLASGIGAGWSPDGRRMAWVSYLDGNYRILVGDAEGQQATEIASAELDGPQVTWVSDTRLAWSTPDKRNFHIRDITTGREELLVKDPLVGWVHYPRFSPRGDRVAVFWDRGGYRGLWLLSWPGRVERLLAPDLFPIGWTPDGRWIYAYRFDSREVVRVAVETGRVESVTRFPMGSLNWRACDFSESKDILVCSLDETKSDAWLIENFDPHVTGQR
jgi:DNA-binding winged helix-turn-helix (wHTH) protein/Tol biopolymer transport system component